MAAILQMTFQVCFHELKLLYFVYFFPTGTIDDRLMLFQVIVVYRLDDKALAKSILAMLESMM